MAAARTLREEAGDRLANCPILVDPMDDRASKAFAAFPERFYVIQDEMVVFEGGKGPADYDINKVEKFLAPKL